MRRLSISETARVTPPSTPGSGVVRQVLGDPEGTAFDSYADSQMVEIGVGHVGVVAWTGNKTVEGGAHFVENRTVGTVATQCSLPARCHPAGYCSL